MPPTFWRRRVMRSGVVAMVTLVTASSRSLRNTVTRSAPLRGNHATPPSMERRSSGVSNGLGCVTTLPARKPRYRSFSVGARNDQPSEPRTMQRGLQRPGDGGARRQRAVAVEIALVTVALPHVAADADADGDTGGRRERPLHEDAAGALVARRGRRRRADGRQESTRRSMLVAETSRVSAPASRSMPETRDCDRNAHAVLRRRHALLNRQRLAHAIAGDRREHLPVRLVAGLTRHAPARAADLPFDGGTKLTEVGAVGLQRRAVLAPLVEQVAAEARGKRRARLDSRRRPAPRRIRRRPGVSTAPRSSSPTRM